MLRHLSLLCGLAMLFGAGLAMGVRSEKYGGYASQAYAWARETLWLSWRDVQAATGTLPWFLFPAEHDGKGVTRGAGMDDGALILLAGYLPRGGGGYDHLRLIRRDGNTVANWDLAGLPIPPHPRYDEPGAPLNHTRTTMPHGLTAHLDGSVALNVGDLAFLKLTRCGRPSLLLLGGYHHDLSLAEGGGYWTLGHWWEPRRTMPADYLPPHTSEFFREKTPGELAAFATQYLHDDTVVRLDEDGKILLEFSIARALYESGLQHMLGVKRVGQWNLVHANSIHELSTELAPAFPMFEAGDLLLSLRDLHSLVVLNPGTRRVKWRRTGPWAWQHDARFQPDGTITLFNNAWNNAYKAVDDHVVERDPALHSNILRLDPASGEVSVVAGREIAEESRFYTRGRGQHQMLPGGDVLVVEAERGRVVQFNPQGRRLWEFINRHDEDQVALVTNAYVYPAGHFQVNDWSCPAR